MSKHALHPVDVPVALHLLQASTDSFAKLASDLKISSSTAHESVRRLVAAGLVRHGLQGERAVNRRALVEFLTHGVRYTFPTALGQRMRGVATAHAGPALRNAIVAEEAVVWPALDGDSEGPEIEPFWPKAADVSRRLPDLYALLSAVDALRVGRTRERQLATAYLTRVIHHGNAATPDTSSRSAPDIE
jgi:DNA-binding Lrp family transcriptional regulator